MVFLLYENNSLFQQYSSFSTTITLPSSTSIAQFFGFLKNSSQIDKNSSEFAAYFSYT